MLCDGSDAMQASAIKYLNDLNPNYIRCIGWAYSIRLELDFSMKTYIDRLWKLLKLGGKG